MERQRIRYVSYALILTILSGLPVYAQTGAAPTAQAPNAQASTKAPSTKKQVINFEDELIEGSVDKPDLFYLFQKKNFNYKRLIRLRENFLPEIRRSSEDIKRLRGGH